MGYFDFEGGLYPDVPENIRTAIFRLRYQVYCLEWGFEKEEDHPGGVETDEFDPHAVHIAARLKGAPSTEVIGTSRVIVGCEVDRFPIECHCSFFSEFKPPPREFSGEISRLAVSKHFRRRAVDKLIFSHGDPAYESEQALSAASAQDRRKSENEIVAGIYMHLYAESKRLGITHWYAVMAKGLHLLLKRWGVVFHPIGPELNYHGWRGPYLAEIAEIEKNLERRNPALIEGARKILWQSDSKQEVI